jgi:hypothetical protein
MILNCELFGSVNDTSDHRLWIRTTTMKIISPVDALALFALICRNVKDLRTDENALAAGLLVDLCHRHQDAAPLASGHF